MTSNRLCPTIPRFLHSDVANSDACHANLSTGLAAHPLAAHVEIPVHQHDGSPHDARRLARDFDILKHMGDTLVFVDLCADIEHSIGHVRKDLFSPTPELPALFEVERTDGVIGRGEVGGEIIAEPVPFEDSRVNGFRKAGGEMFESSCDRGRTVFGGGAFRLTCHCFWTNVDGFSGKGPGEIF